MTCLSVDNSTDRVMFEVDHMPMDRISSKLKVSVTLWVMSCGGSRARVAPLEAIVAAVVALVAPGMPPSSMSMIKVWLLVSYSMPLNCKEANASTRSRECLALYLSRDTYAEEAVLEEMEEEEKEEEEGDGFEKEVADVDDRDSREVS